MKKLLCLFACYLCLSTGLRAQELKEGNVLLDANLDLLAMTDADFHFSLGFGIEYMLTDKWSYGIGFSYGNFIPANISIYGVSDSNPGSQFIGMLSMSNYVKLAPRLYYETAISFAYTHSKVKMEWQGAEVTGKADALQLIASPGLKYLLTERLTLSMSIGGITAGLQLEESNKFLRVNWNTISMGVGFRF